MSKVFYYVLAQHQYVIINRLIFATFINHLQASVYYMEVHSVCTYIMGSHSVYIKTQKLQKFKIYWSGCILQDICGYCASQDHVNLYTYRVDLELMSNGHSIKVVLQSVRICT